MTNTSWSTAVRLNVQNWLLRAAQARLQLARADGRVEVAKAELVLGGRAQCVDCRAVMWLAQDYQPGKIACSWCDSQRPPRIIAPAATLDAPTAEDER